MEVALYKRRQFLQGGLALAGLGILPGCGWVSSLSPARVPQLGILWGGPAGTDPIRAAFLDQLQMRGWIEGQNLVTVHRFAEGKPERLPELAAELVALKVDVLFTGTGVVGIRALMGATREIPIVIFTASDAVEERFVASYAAPGGNVTGISLSPQTGAKRLQLLKEAAPSVSRVAMLWEAGSPGPSKVTEAAAQTVGVEVRSFAIRESGDLDGALTSVASWPADGLIMSSGVILYARRSQVLEFASTNRLPAIYYTREYPDAGGLMSYGPNFPGSFRQAANLVDKILRGARPADLPVEQPTVFDFVVNKKTADALSLTVPRSVLSQATAIIQ